MIPPSAAKLDRGNVIHFEPSGLLTFDATVAVALNNFLASSTPPARVGVCRVPKSSQDKHLPAWAEPVPVGRRLPQARARRPRHHGPCCSMLSW